MVYSVYMKTCKDCKQSLPLSEYYVYRHGEKTTYYARCKPCQRSKLKREVTPEDKARGRRNSRQRAYDRLAAMKTGPCVDCKVSYPHYVMDYDHVRGEKTKNLAKMVGRTSWDKILEEIDKCELVCSNCHRIRTHIRKEQK